MGDIHGVLGLQRSKGGQGLISLVLDGRVLVRGNGGGGRGSAPHAFVERGPGQRPLGIQTI